MPLKTLWFCYFEFFLLFFSFKIAKFTGRYEHFLNLSSPLRRESDLTVQMFVIYYIYVGAFFSNITPGFLMDPTNLIVLATTLVQVGSS